MRVWSYGGGTQTIAIALLIEDGRLPLPDRNEKIYQTHGVRLHKSRLPLPMVQLQPTQEQDGGLFDICDGGTCWT